MDDISGNSEGGSRKRWHALRRAGCGERESPHHDAARELDLETVVAGGSCLGERGLGSAPKSRSASTHFGQNLFCFTGPPWLESHTAQREPSLLDRVAFHAQRGRGR